MLCKRTQQRTRLANFTALSLYIRPQRCQNRPMRKLVLLALFAAGRLVAAEAVPGSVTVHTAAPEHEVTFTPAQATNEFLADFVRWVGEDAGKLPRRDSVLAVGSSSMRQGMLVDSRQDGRLSNFP